MIRAAKAIASSGDTDLTATDALTAADMVVGKTSGEVIFRFANASDASFDPNQGSSITNGSNLLTLEAGSDLPLNAYFLGDVNGDYANQIT